MTTPARPVFEVGQRVRWLCVLRGRIAYRYGYVVTVCPLKLRNRFVCRDDVTGRKFVPRECRIEPHPQEKQE